MTKFSIAFRSPPADVEISVVEFSLEFTPEDSIFIMTHRRIMSHVLHAETHSLHADLRALQKEGSTRIDCNG